MIRVDSYRLATAIESFVSACHALRVRLKIRPVTDPEVQRAMEARLRQLTGKVTAAVRKLRTVHAQRLEKSFDGDPRAGVDARVQEYVDSLLLYADGLVGS